MAYLCGMKQVLLTVFILLASLPAQAQGFNPFVENLGPAPIRTRVSFSATFEELGLSRSGYDHIRLSCSPGLIADPSDFYVGYEDPKVISLSFDTDVAGCFGFGEPMGIWAYGDSIRSYEALYVTASVYDPNIVGKFLYSDTLNFRTVSVGKIDTLSFELEADSIGMAYRNLAVHEVRTPFYSVDTIYPNFCAGGVNTTVRFAPSSPDHYIDTVYLLDPLTNDSLPLILIGDGVAPDVVNRAPEEVPMQVYPNPCNQFANIVLPSQALEQVEIRNALGDVVRSYQGVNSDFTLDASRLPDGIYFIEVRAKGAVITKKLVVIH